MSVTVGDLLRILVNAARNAGVADGSENEDGDVYTLAEKHDAILGIIGDFVRRTWCIRASTSVDLTQDSDQVSVSDSAFDPLRLTNVTVDSTAWATATVSLGAVASIAVNKSLIYTSAPAVTFSGGGGSGAAATANLTLGRITSFTINAGGSNYTEAPDVLLDGSRVNFSPSESNNGLSVRRCELNEINDQIAIHGTGSGVPKLIAFGASKTNATIYRKPKADGTLTIDWAPLYGFTASFAPGDTGAASISLLVPDDMARTAVRTGGVSILQHGILESVPMSDRGWQAYLAHVTACSGIGGSSPSFRRIAQRRADW